MKKTVSNHSRHTNNSTFSPKSYKNMMKNSREVRFNTTQFIKNYVKEETAEDKKRQKSLELLQKREALIL